MSDNLLRAEVRRYYEGKFREFGASARGVDWNSEESQELRFRQLVTLLDDPDATILDYGCGYGALEAYLRRRGHRGLYIGYDLSPALIDAAREHTDAHQPSEFTTATPSPADYALASGIFNVRMGTPESEWEAYVYRTLAEMAALGTRGFAFNVLSRYSDPDKRRDTLFYADPLALFDYCKRTYSRAVSLLHDYPLYEFTMLIRF